MKGCVTLTTSGAHFAFSSPPDDLWVVQVLQFLKKRWEKGLSYRPLITQMVRLDISSKLRTDYFSLSFAVYACV
jgi:hypothetical protein